MGVLLATLIYMSIDVVLVDSDSPLSFRYGGADLFSDSGDCCCAPVVDVFFFSPFRLLYGNELLHYLSVIFDG